MNVGVVEVDLSAGRDLDGAVGELAAGDRQVHGCSLPGAVTTPSSAVVR
jgi:hypothetical protein